MPWWTLTVLIFISFIFCALYGTLAAVIGFYEFTSSGTGFFQMITGEIRDVKLILSSVFLLWSSAFQLTSFLANPSRTCTALCTANIR